MDKNEIIIYKDNITGKKFNECIDNPDYEYYVFVVKKGTRVCQGAFRKVENPDCILGELNMENNRGGGYGHGGTK